MKAGPIWLVEDDPNDADLTRRALERRGVDNEVTILRDGEEAICYLNWSSLKEGHDEDPLPALILVDLKLPKIDGIEVIRRIRANSRHGRQPVVVFTSSNMTQDIHAAYQAGASSYVRKPVNAEEFTEVVHLIARYWLGLNEGPIDATA